MSRDVLAEQIGVSRTTIQSWEEGSAAPPAHKLRAVADALGCSSDYLLGRDPANQGKALVNAALIREVESIIASKDRDRARAVLNSDPPMILLGILVLEGAELRSVVEAEVELMALQQRFADTFPELAKHWSRRHKPW